MRAIDHNSTSRQPLDPYEWAGYAANHHRPEPESSATAAQPVSPTVLNCWAVVELTVCPGPFAGARDIYCGGGRGEGSGR